MRVLAASINLWFVHATIREFFPSLSVHCFNKTHKLRETQTTTTKILNNKIDDQNQNTKEIPSKYYIFSFQKKKKAKKKYLKASTFSEESFNGFHIAGSDDDIVEQLGFGTLLWFHWIEILAHLLWSSNQDSNSSEEQSEAEAEAEC